MSIPSLNRPSSPSLNASEASHISAGEITTTDLVASPAVDTLQVLWATMDALSHNAPRISESGCLSTAARARIAGAISVLQTELRSQYLTIMRRLSITENTAERPLGIYTREEYIEIRLHQARGHTDERRAEIAKEAGLQYDAIFKRISK